MYRQFINKRQTSKEINHRQNGPTDHMVVVNHYHNESIQNYPSVANSNSPDEDTLEAAMALASLPNNLDSLAASSSSSFLPRNIHIESNGNSERKNSIRSLITPQGSFDATNNLDPKSLKSRKGLPPLKPLDCTPSESTLMPTSTSVSMFTPAPAPTVTKPSPFYGSISLSMPGDSDSLSPLHCFIRKHGIEAFVVSDPEADAYSFWEARNFRVRPGLVGIRCKHCKNRPVRSRGQKSIHYPSSTKCIYYSMENWQRHHALSCPDVPKWIIRELTKLMNESRTGSGGRRNYWSVSANNLGMVDTPRGVQFAVHPEQALSALTNYNNSAEDIQANLVSTSLPAHTSKGDISLVDESDKLLISEYLFLLMSQMESCVFSEDDRIGSRSKIKNINIGHPGIQCGHCNGMAGVGRYFPTSLQSLTLANSDRNMYNHLKKCRRCPEDIKEKLKKTRDQYHQADLKIKRGSRKAFFLRVWKKLHGENKPEAPSQNHKGVTMGDVGMDMSPIRNDLKVQERSCGKEEASMLSPVSIKLSDNASNLTPMECDQADRSYQDEQDAPCNFSELSISVKNEGKPFLHPQPFFHENNAPSSTAGAYVSSVWPGSLDTSSRHGSIYPHPYTGDRPRNVDPNNDHQIAFNSYQFQYPYQEWGQYRGQSSYRYPYPPVNERSQGGTPLTLPTEYPVPFMEI